MCLVLDTNAFSLCFDLTNKEHNEFRPVLNWLSYGKGKLVYGGKKYKDELKKASSYMRYFAALNRAGKVIVLDDDMVDKIEIEVKNLESSKNFDDPHLVAIVLMSKCKVICTNDARAIPFIKDQKFYTGITAKPKLYTSSKNIKLLTDKYIAEICKPCDRLSKKKADVLFSR